MIRISIAALTAVVVCGCAAPRPHGDGGRDFGPPPGPRANGLFISPAGEPFRPAGDGVSGLEMWFAQADIDHDGAITLAEFTADHSRFFGRLDVNRDGVIAGAEVTRYEQDIVPEILTGVDRGEAARPGGRGASAGRSGGGGRGGGGGGGGGRGGGGGGGGGGRRGGGGGGGGRGGGGGGDEGGSSGGGQGGGGSSSAKAGVETRVGAALFDILDEPEPVRVADLNIDFEVTAAEWMMAAKRRFDELDANHDGRLALSELHPPGRGGPGRGGGGGRGRG